jgi:hypothetical protein
VKWFFATTLAILGLACGLVPESVSFGDPRVAELMKALQAVDRAALGFTPIDRNARLTLEARPREGYDAMLHVSGKTSRTIAFRRAGTTYQWIGEQETFEGPREYETPDGRFQEAITITFETAHVSGVPLNRVHVSYRGEDAQLADLEARQQLTLEAVRPALTAWGYWTGVRK